MKKYRIDVTALLMSERSEINLSGCGYELRQYSADVGAYVPTVAYSYECKSEENFAYTFESARQILTVDPSFIGYVRGNICNRYREIRPPAAPVDVADWVLQLGLAPSGVWQQSQLHIAAVASGTISQMAKNARFCYLSRDDWVSLVHTAYGGTAIIARLYEALIEFYTRSTNETIRLSEELTIKAFTSKNFNWFPPQVADFQLHKNSDQQKNVV